MWLSRCLNSGPGKLNRDGGAGRSRTADLEFRKLLLYPSELQPPTHIIPAGNVHTWSSFLHPTFMLAGQRTVPFALIVGLIIMIAALLFTAFNRHHAVSPQPPTTHQSR
jgi:hypothetical protein